MVVAARVVSALNRLMVTGLPARTCPLMMDWAGGVAVRAFPKIVRVSGMYKISVNEPLPCETRALHSIAVWPDCKPVTLKLNATPLVVALLPPLPAMARMKLPFCGPFNAEAGLGPKRVATEILLTSTKLASNTQVNSVLV